MNPNPIANPVTERELAARSAAPRVQADDLEQAVASEHYFTAKHGVLGVLAADGVGPTVYERANAAPQALGLLTLCVLVLRNGFTVTGTSACASAANFDADIGKRIARQDALRQLWPLLGYALVDRIHHAPAMQIAVEQLQHNANTCLGNAPIHEQEGNLAQAELSRENGAAYLLAIARLMP